jgi:AmiR/NasT family two-component response regulator
MFETTRSSYLVVDRDLCIRAVNPAYEEATCRARAELLARPMFDAFPPNPVDPTDDGASQLQASFETVFSQGTRHYMGLQRYDIPDPSEPGMFRYKVWAPVNSPIRDELGRTVAVLHHVEDLTRLVPRQTNAVVDAAVDTVAIGSRLPLTEDFVKVAAAFHEVRAAQAQAQAQYETLRDALETNRQIATAVGMMMSSARVSQQEAFDMLVKTSQQSHRKLREVAADLVAAFGATLTD